MGMVASLRLVGAGLAWRTAGPKSAGRLLLETTRSDDEQERMIAVISLVKAGDRTVDLLSDSYNRGSLQPEALRLLVDIGSEGAERLLGELATESGDLGDTATQCLETLHRRSSYRDDDQH